MRQSSSIIYQLVQDFFHPQYHVMHQSCGTMDHHWLIIVPQCHITPTTQAINIEGLGLASAKSTA